MSLQLISDEAAAALIAGDTYAAISTEVKEQYYNHFLLMPASVRALALSIEVATLPQLEAAFCLALFVDAGEPPPVPPPSARFTMSVSSGTAPLAVVFTDGSLSVVTSRSWTFGDGQTSALQNPLHTFSSPGDFTVTLTVVGPGGTDSITHSVHVGAAPTGAGPIPYVCTATGALRVGDIVGYFRPTVAMSLLDLSAQLSKADADNGMTIGVVNASGQSLGAAGELTLAADARFGRRAGPLALAAGTTYGIKILSYEGGGDDDGGGDGGDGSLTADFTWAQYNHGLTFTAGGTLASSDDPIVGWHWDFGDGEESEESDGSTTHFYDATGSWDVTLTVTTQSDATATITHTVTIAEPPSAKFRGETQRANPAPAPAEGVTVTALCQPV